MDLKYTKRTSEQLLNQKFKITENWTTSKQCAKDFPQPQNLIKQYQKSK